jgi:hypothetical protein
MGPVNAAPIAPAPVPRHLPRTDASARPTVPLSPGAIGAVSAPPRL